MAWMSMSLAGSTGRGLGKMDEVANYGMIWAAYLLAATAFLTVFWKLTRFQRAQWLAYLLRSIAIAVVLTPWYANDQSEVLVPALMVLTLDSITLGTESAYRALVPLLLSLVFCMLGGAALFLFKRNKNQ